MLDRNAMLDDVIRMYGFEVEETISFAILCERGTDEEINRMYDRLLND